MGNGIKRPFTIAEYVQDDRPHLIIQTAPLTIPGFRLSGNVLPTENNAGDETPLSKLPTEGVQRGDTCVIFKRVQDSIDFSCAVFDGQTWANLSYRYMHDLVDGSLTTSAFGSSAKAARRRKISQLRRWLRSMSEAHAPVMKQGNGSYTFLQIS